MAALERPASRNHTPSVRYAVSCTDWKRIFEATCPARFRRYTSCSEIAGSKHTIASVLSAPFFIAPSDSASMPARHVRSAGVHPRAAIALATRPPSRCARRPRSCATSTSSGSGPANRRCHDRSEQSVTAPRAASGVGRPSGWGRGRAEACRARTGSCRRQRPHHCAAPEHRCRPHSLCRMCAVSWQRTAPPRRAEGCQGERVGSGAGDHWKDLAAGCSKTSRTLSRSSAVHSSAPYASAEPRWPR